MPVRTLIRARSIYRTARDAAPARAILLEDDRIVATSPAPDGLDASAGSSARVIDDQTLTILPAFYDTHCHLREFARNIALVPVDRATTVAEFLELVREQASRVPPGTWIQTSNAWHEKNLVEQRAPTARELDAAIPEHPVLARRGGHMAFANSLALKMAGITAQSPNPPGGVFGRDGGGSLDGMLEGSAQYGVARLIPALSRDDLIANVERASRALAEVGLAAVRDPIVLPADVVLYHEAAESKCLTVRCRLMPLVMPTRNLDDARKSIDAYDALRARDDDLVRIWGLKLVMDGGAEGGALDAPYANDPTFSGHLNWDPDVMTKVVDLALSRGFRVGTHCCGDRAVRTVLDCYEKARAQHPGLAAGSLALEHAFLADRTQRSRAISMGVHVTVQHPLLYALGAQLLDYWGADRTRQVMPVKAWLDEGADLSAGTDYPVGSYDPMESIWGMVTRQTKTNGVQGPEYAIDVRTAIDLYTASGAALDGEGATRGTLEPGKIADIIAYREDPFVCSVDALRSLPVCLTLVGGRETFSSQKGIREPRA
jgi:predicted amidohydrolase YtcJ